MTQHRQIIAILRGLTPPEAINVCRTLCDAGITHDRGAVQFARTAQVDRGGGEGPRRSGG